MPRKSPGPKKKKEEHDNPHQIIGTSGGSSLQATPTGPTQTVISEDLITGKTVRKIGGEVREASSLGRMSLTPPMKGGCSLTGIK